nr:immunoglobulin heavy chain junction region [Macaca mulatta]
CAREGPIMVELDFW